MPDRDQLRSVLIQLVILAPPNPRQWNLPTCSSCLPAPALHTMGCCSRTLPETGRVLHRFNHDVFVSVADLGPFLWLWNWASQALLACGMQWNSSLGLGVLNLGINVFVRLLFSFWFCWIFVAAQGLSLVGESWGFSLQWFLLRSTGSRAHGLNSCSGMA